MVPIWLLQWTLLKLSKGKENWIDETFSVIVYRSFQGSATDIGSFNSRIMVQHLKSVESTSTPFVKCLNKNKIAEHQGSWDYRLSLTSPQPASKIGSSRKGGMWTKASPFLRKKIFTYPPMKKSYLREENKCFSNTVKYYLRNQPSI